MIVFGVSSGAVYSGQAHQALGTAFETCTLQTRTAFIFFFVIMCISSDGFADDRRPISSHVST